MEFLDGVLRMEAFYATTLGIIVLFVGKSLNARVDLLRDFNIPEPVTGGLLFSLAFTVLYVAAGVEVDFEMHDRDQLLAIFFTTIGLNSRVSDLTSGGRPLVVLLLVTIAYMFVQNLIGLGMAQIFGYEGAAGLLVGTVSLIGGHGTAIAWAPTFLEQYGVEQAMEVGISSATGGLILASLMGGPIARFLISRHDLTSGETEAPDVGLEQGATGETIDYVTFLQAILAIHLSAVVGIAMNEAFAQAGLKLPLFVTCLFGGIVLTNVVPRLMPRLVWPARTKSMSLVADVSLGVFLAMSLMSMQLWTIFELAGPLLATLGVQALVAILLAIFVVFPLMGANFDAAVICSGFGGISLGSTATAMANMTAVTQRYGTSHLAFVVVPLVCAFFIDLVNVVMINFFLGQY